MAEIRVNSTGGVKLFDADDSHYAQIKAGTVTSNTDVLELGSSAVVAGTKVDLNGQELILDADADTSITADTDDQIDVRIAGADDFQFTANTFTAQSGSSIVVPDGGLTLGSTAVSSTAAELNLLDGGTSVGSSITLADADGFVVNDGGTMKTIPATDLKTYNPGGVYTRVGGSASATNAADITYDNIMTNDYYQYLITGMVETTEDAYLEIILRTGGSSGANAGGNYQQSWNGWGSSGSDSYLHNSGDLTASSILPMSNAAETKNDGDDDHGVYFSMILYTRYLNKTYWRCNAQFLNNDKSRIYGYENVGWQVNTGAITGLNFAFNAGSIDNHRIDIYGLTSG